MTDAKDQHIKELQNLLAAEKEYVHRLHERIIEYERRLEQIADIAEEAQ